MNKSTAFVIFVCGAVAGVFIACRLSKNRYERILKEEIDSVRKAFCKHNAKEDISEFVDTIVDEGYISSSDMPKDTPYVISPEEFGEFEDYETVSLTYYEDDVLADDNDEIIEDVDDIIGKNSLTHFGEYEDDSVFVRNDRLKCDYEILKDLRNYSDVIKTQPQYRMEEQ